LDSLKARIHRFVSGRRSGKGSVAAAADRFDRRDGEVWFGYSKDPPAELIDADKIALPDSTTCVELLDAVSPDLAERWRMPSPEVLKPPDLVGPLPRTRLMVKGRSHYVRLVQRMLVSEIVDIVTQQPKVTNGLFAVAKPDGTQRLIVNAQPANQHFWDPPSPGLPTPTEIAKLRIPPGQQLWVAKNDMSNMFHLLRLPGWLCDYFGLPALTAGELGLQHLPPDTRVWPRCRRAPMGWKCSPGLAQDANVNLVMDSGVSAGDLILAGCSDFELGNRVRCMVYLDDVVFFALTHMLERMRATQVDYMGRGTGRGWVFAAKKTRWPALCGDVLGLLLDGAAGTYGKAPPAMGELIAGTEIVLQARSVSTQGVRSLLGRWIWALLAFRPALSAFAEIWRWLDRCGARAVSVARLPPAVARELTIAVGVAPLAYSNLRLETARDVVATDASEFGFGVVAATPAAALVRDAAQVTGKHSIPMLGGVDGPRVELQPILDSRWRTILATPVRVASHITSLEATAVVMATRWLLSSPYNLGKQVLLLSDNAAVVCGAAKGRSSSPALRFNLARLAAWCLAGDLRLAVSWVPTAHNPADSPSRLFTPTA
jgi:hypothetical protein